MCLSQLSGLPRHFVLHISGRDVGHVLLSPCFFNDKWVVCFIAECRLPLSSFAAGDAAGLLALTAL